MGSIRAVSSRFPTPGGAQPGSADTSASPLLIFIAIFLFLMLSILEIDLHRDELRTLGLVGAPPIDSALLAP